MSRADYERLIAQGIDVETVGDLLGDERAVNPVAPPRLDGQPEFPEPGLYFDMPEADYHAIHAASSSGLKRLAVSSMDYWADSPMNPEREREEAAHLSLGKAYHKRIVEGATAYALSYATALDKADFSDALVTTDQIKAAIVAAGAKPCTKGYDDLTRAARKEDWIAQLADIDPAIQVWDALVAEDALHYGSYERISAQADRRVQIAARMIEAHPELSGAFKGGYAEVSAFWHCPETGCPMKARFDYLKMRAIVDLKSYSAKSQRPVERQIDYEIASYKYYLQVVVYMEAARAMRALLLRQPNAAHGSVEEIAWAARWAKQTADPAMLWVFQKAGPAPVTRGRWMGQGTTYSVTSTAVQRLKAKWVSCAETYGTLPWIDEAPISHTADEDLPLSACDL